MPAITSGDFGSSIGVSASGLRAQSVRMRIIAENLANADSTGTTPGAAPYRRRIAAFAPDDAGGVKLRSVGADSSPFIRVHSPGHPAADGAGYVWRPNVSSSIEMADMKAAQRSYSANLSAIEAARGLAARTLDVLK